MTKRVKCSRGKEAVASAPSVSLSTLAKRLHLTPKERCWSELVVAGVPRTQAAEQAGYAGRPKERAYRLASVPKVQQYIAALEQAAAVQAQHAADRLVASVPPPLRPAVKAQVDRVTGLGDQSTHTALAQGALVGVVRRTRGARVTHRVKRDGEGNVVERTVERTEDGGGAARALLEHERRAGSPPVVDQSRAAILVVLQDPAAAAALRVVADRMAAPQLPQAAVVVEAEPEEER